MGIEKTTGQPKSLLAGGGALFGLFLVFFLCPPQLVFSAVGVGYPTYASLKMLAEDKTEDAAIDHVLVLVFAAQGRDESPGLHPRLPALLLLPQARAAGLALLADDEGRGRRLREGREALRLPAFGGVEVRLD